MSLLVVQEARLSRGVMRLIELCFPASWTDAASALENDVPLIPLLDIDGGSGPRYELGGLLILGTARLVGTLGEGEGANELRDDGRVTSLGVEGTGEAAVGLRAPATASAATSLRRLLTFRVPGLWRAFLASASCLATSMVRNRFGVSDTFIV